MNNEPDLFFFPAGSGHMWDANENIHLLIIPLDSGLNHYYACQGDTSLLIKNLDEFESLMNRKDAR
jgi:hypothetical protein